MKEKRDATEKRAFFCVEFPPVNPLTTPSEKAKNLKITLFYMNKCFFTVTNTIWMALLIKGEQC